MLSSRVGTAVTALNWNNERVNNLGLNIRVPFKVKSVTSVIRGALKFERGPGTIRVSLPITSADIVVIRPYPGAITDAKSGQVCP
jgi:hypothetical protein